MIDAFGNTLSSTSQDAVRAYDRAVDAYLHAWVGVAPALDDAIAADPAFALPRAMRALDAVGTRLHALGDRGSESAPVAIAWGRRYRR